MRRVAAARRSRAGGSVAHSAIACPHRAEKDAVERIGPSSIVIPAKAGIQGVALGPRLRGDDEDGFRVAENKPDACGLSRLQEQPLPPASEHRCAAPLEPPPLADDAALDVGLFEGALVALVFDVVGG